MSYSQIQALTALNYCRELSGLLECIANKYLLGIWAGEKTAEDERMIIESSLLIAKTRKFLDRIEDEPENG